MVVGLLFCAAFVVISFSLRPQPETGHARQDSVWISFEWILDGRGLSSEPNARHEAENYDGRDRPRHAGDSTRGTVGQKKGRINFLPCFFLLLVLFLGLINVRRLTEEHFGRFHHRLAEGGMGMNR